MSFKAHDKEIEIWMLLHRKTASCIFNKKKIANNIPDKDMNKYIEIHQLFNYKLLFFTSPLFHPRKKFIHVQQYY